MFSGLAHFSSGDVVSANGLFFVVQTLDGGGKVLLRFQTASETRHRADVSPQHWSEVARCGLPVQDLVVRCVPVWHDPDCRFSKLGQVSDIMRDKIVLALKREIRVRRYEEGPSMRSNLTANTSSSGRRVSTMRYA